MDNHPTVELRIPSALARAIQSDACVIWLGANLMPPDQLPGWESVLASLVESCVEDIQLTLVELLEQGRLRTVLTYFHRHLGPEVVEQRFEEWSAATTESMILQGVGELPVRGYLATAYAERVVASMRHRGLLVDVIDRDKLDISRPWAGARPFVVPTPPLRLPMRTDAELLAFIEELTRFTTVLLVGFESNDPDLAELLDIFDWIHPEGDHFALMAGLTQPEIEEWYDRYALRVVPLRQSRPVADVLNGLARACVHDPVNVDITERMVAPTELSGGAVLRVAYSHMHRGETTQAIQAVDDVLMSDPDNEEAFELLITLNETNGDWVGVIQARERFIAFLERREQDTNDIAELAELQDRRAAEWQTVVEIRDRELNDPQGSIRALDRMLEVRPHDQAALHQKLDLLTKQEAWPEVLEVLQVLAEQQDEAARRAKYLYAKATILRDKLHDEHASDRCLVQVLEVDPSNERAYQARFSALSDQEDWKSVARLIRAKLKAESQRLAPIELMALFEQLAEIYRKLDDDETALAALDQAARLSERAGEDVQTRCERRQRVMRLAIQQDALDKALHHGHHVLLAQPMDFETYHRMVELYLKAGQREHARCFARTLVFLRQADEAEVELATAPMQVPQGVVDRERFRSLVQHPDVDAQLSDLYAMVWPVVALRETQSAVEQGLLPEFRVDVRSQSPTVLGRSLATACYGFDTAIPPVYLCNEIRDIGVTVACERESSRWSAYAAIMANPHFPQLPPPADRFMIARTIVRLRPDFLLVSMLPSIAHLRFVFWGTVQATEPGAHIPPDAHAAADVYAQCFADSLTPERQEQLRSLVEPLLGSEPDHLAWAQGVLHTCNRAGLLWCGSLEAASQVAAQADETGLPQKERLADLIAYSISESYLTLRAEMTPGEA